MFDERRAYPLVLIALVLSLVTHARIFVWLAVVLIGVLIARPSLLRPVADLLETIGKTIGTALSDIVLTGIFYGFIVPYGMLYRIFNRPLARRFRGEERASTYFTSANRSYTKELFEKQW